MPTSPGWCQGGGRKPQIVLEHVLKLGRARDELPVGEREVYAGGPPNEADRANGDADDGTGAL